MANLKFNHVWVIDTPAASVETEHVLVRTIRWVGATNADAVEITDLDPKLSTPTVWESVWVTGDASSEESNPYDIVFPHGFGVPVLDGGVLYVYLAVAGFR